MVEPLLVKQLVLRRGQIRRGRGQVGHRRGHGDAHRIGQVFFALGAGPSGGSRKAEENGQKWFQFVNQAQEVVLTLA